MLRLCLAAALMVAAGPAGAEIRITNDSGGNLKIYESRVQAVRASGEKVVIDGECRSACTLYLNLPRDQICSTARGAFVFHTASNELGVPDWRGNESLLDAYPPHVRYEVLRRDGMWLKPVMIKGTTLVPACR